MDSEDTNTHTDEPSYRVVINHEEQYSIWPIHKENPAGWEDAGTSGTKEECLAYIGEVWTDMRPLSLRRQMEQQEAEREEASAAPDAGSDGRQEREREEMPRS